MKKAMWITPVVVIIAAWFFWFSSFLAHHTIGTDFPVFYNAAQAIIDGKSVYGVESLRNYQIPESIRNGAFIYSLPIAYLMTPLALLPYYTAKTLMIYFSIISYLSAIAIVLKINNAKNRWFVYPMVLSVFFMPFIHDLRSAQINCLILFLIVTSVYFAIKNLPYVCGTILALASLFKIFPIAIAMILGIKNWRIMVVCAVVFGSSFLVPGSFEWVHSISNIHRADYVLLFIMLGPYWFVLYGSIIAGMTALIVWRSKKVDYPLFASFSISAVLLSMPIVEYYHLTLIILPYIYLLTRNKMDFILIITLLVSFILTNTAFFLSRGSVYFPTNLTVSKTLITLGLTSLWGILAWETAQMK